MYLPLSVHGGHTIQWWIGQIYLFSQIERSPIIAAAATTDLFTKPFNHRQASSSFLLLLLLFVQIISVILFCLLLLVIVFIYIHSYSFSHPPFYFIISCIRCIFFRSFFFCHHSFISVVLVFGITRIHWQNLHVTWKCEHYQLRW